MRTPAVALGLALLAGLLSAPGAAADVVLLQGAIDEALLDVQEAARLLLNNDRVGAKEALDDALADADAAVAAAADEGTQEELGPLATKVVKKVGVLRKAVLKARDTMNDPNAPDLKAVKTAARAAKAAFGAAAGFSGIPVVGATPVLVDGRSAGFHDPGDFVQIRILRGLDEFGDPCEETPEFVVVDPFGNGSVVAGTPVSVTNPDGSITVTVQMGASGGPARLEVTACGRTRSMPLFNYGPVGSFAPKLSVNRFDGVYTGSYSGNAVVSGVGQVPVEPGAVTLTVSGGVITVTQPGSGQGTLNVKGTAGITGSGAVEGGGSYQFTGKFTATAIGTGPGSAIAGGSWVAVFEGGVARGSWSAGR